MTVERWKPVPGHEGLYAVSDQGRVQRLRRTHEVNAKGRARPFERHLQTIYLKAQPNNGSPVVTLYREGKRWQVSIARLVREAFGR